MRRAMRAGATPMAAGARTFSPSATSARPVRRPWSNSIGRAMNPIRRGHHGEASASCAFRAAAVPHHRHQVRAGHDRGFTDRAPGGERRCLRFFPQLRGAALRTLRLVLQCGPGTGRPRHGRLRARSPHPGRGRERTEARRAVRACRTEAHLLRQQQRVLFAATPKRNDWIEASRDPRLRGRQ